MTGLGNEEDEAERSRVIEDNDRLQMEIADLQDRLDALQMELDMHKMWGDLGLMGGGVSRHSH